MLDTEWQHELEDIIAHLAKYGIPLLEGCIITSLPSMCVLAADETAFDYCPRVKGAYHPALMLMDPPCQMDPPLRKQKHPPPLSMDPPPLQSKKPGLGH